MSRIPLRWSLLPALCLSFLVPLLAQSTSHRPFVTPITYPVGNPNAQFPSSVYDIASGDLDGDGKPDLVFSISWEGNSSPGPYLRWLKGNGDGTYTEKPISNALDNLPEHLLLADVNGDGRLDLITTATGTIPAGIVVSPAAELDIYLGNGDGTFQPPQRYLQGISVSTPVLADLNGDGKPDLAVVTRTSQGSAIQPLLNNGDGTFHLGQAFADSALGTLGSVLGAGDFNSDRKADLLVYEGSDNGSAQVLRVLTNDGEGVFSSGASYTLPRSRTSANHPAAVLDVNHDGRADLVLALWDRVLVLLGNGDGTFRGTGDLQKPLRYPTGQAQEANILPGDFNKDGIPDFVAGPYVYLGRGDGSFTVTAAYSTTADGGNSNAAEVAVDLNGDGHLDLVWSFQPAFGASIETALGNGGSRQPFQAPLETVVNLPFTNGPLATGDFNRDGIPDVAAGCSMYYSPPNNEICVFTGTGKGYLNPPQIYKVNYNGSPYPFDGPLAVGDINGDGILDIVVTNLSPNSPYDVAVLRGKKDGTFQAPQTSLVLNKHTGGGYTLLVDINKDGKLDLVGSWGVALGNGDGTFQKAKPLPPDIGHVLAIASADFNRDGYPDLAVLDGSWSYPFDVKVNVLLGNGSGTFPTDRRFQNPNMAGGLAVADLNKDGIPDLLYGVGDNPPPHYGLSVVLGTGDGSFGPPTSYLFDSQYNQSFGIHIADFDRDGHVDVFMTAEDHIEYFHGLSGGKFAPRQEYLVETHYLPAFLYSQFGILDLNGDGYPDIAISDDFGVIRLLNTGAKSAAPQKGN